MGIQEKLEDIKRQPEHIRMRYVLGCVFVSMIFVLIVWAVSLKKNFESLQRDPAVQNTMDGNSFNKAVEELKNQKDAIIEESKQFGGQGTSVREEMPSAVPAPDAVTPMP
jgi:hypothetical protein